MEPDGSSQRQQPGQRFTRALRNRTLSSLRAVDADQSHPPAVATGKGVPIDDAANDAAGLLCLRLARGARQQQHLKGEASDQHGKSRVHA